MKIEGSEWYYFAVKDSQILENFDVVKNQKLHKSFQKMLVF